METEWRFDHNSMSRKGQLMGIEIDDLTIANALSKPETSQELREFSTVVWLKGTIAMESDGRASEVTDRELLTRYRIYGSFVWDHNVVSDLEAYLKSQGYLL